MGAFLSRNKIPCFLCRATHAFITNDFKRRRRKTSLQTSTTHLLSTLDDDIRYDTCQVCYDLFYFDFQTIMDEENGSQSLVMKKITSDTLCFLCCVKENTYLANYDVYKRIRLTNYCDACVLTIVKLRECGFETL